MKNLMKLPVLAFATALLMTAQSCDDKKEIKPEFAFKTPEEASLTLHHGETHFLQFSGRDQNSLDFSVEDTLVAKIASDGLVTGGLVGTTAFTVKQGNESLKGAVEVEPRVETIVEPIFIPRKTTRKMVEQYEKRKFSKEIPFGVDDVLLLYKGDRDEVKNIIYIHNTTSDYVKQAIVTLNSVENYTALKTLDFLKERYKLIKIDSELTDPLGNPCPIFARNGKIVKPAFMMGAPAILYQEADETEK